MTEPRTAAGRALLAGMSGISAYRPRGKREVVGIRDAILAIEAQAAAPALDVERLAEAVQSTILTTPNKFMGPGMGAYRQHWKDLTKAEQRQVIWDAEALAAEYARLAKDATP
jgi:NAD(P)H-hydrate repair Nnr-like enzyme with NAD(P)H-hydrate dehydratase domain